MPSQQVPCVGFGFKVDKRAREAGLERQAQCPLCRRTVAVNYDGRLRRHVARLMGGRR